MVEGKDKVSLTSRNLRGNPFLLLSLEWLLRSTAEQQIFLIALFSVPYHCKLFSFVKRTRL